MERLHFDDQIRKNKIYSFLLIFFIFLVFLALGYIISFAYDPGYFFIIMIFAIIISLLYILISYYNSDKIAIASARAKIASREKYRQYYNSVEGLCLASGMPVPKLYIMESNQINAFASGRNPKNAVICVTTGALEKLNKQELEGVLAHELSHIANFDIRFMTLTAVMIGMIAIISELFLRSLWFKSNDRDNKAGAILMIIGIILAILAPIVTQLVQLAISRKREYAADASGVKFTRYPPGLINALKKIKKEHITEENKIRTSKAIATLFIANPFSRVSELTQTHPSLEKRIAILERM